MGAESGPQESGTGFAGHRRSGTVIATFTLLEGDVLRSLAAQLVELLRSEQPARPARPAAAATDPFEALVRHSGMEVADLDSGQPAAAGPPGSESADPASAFRGPSTAPDDPVLARLLPTAYLDDAESAGEFRRFTEPALRDSKVAAATAIIDGLSEAGLPEQAYPIAEGDPRNAPTVLDLELAPPEAMLWLRGFTDIRLALATRLGVEDGDEGRWWALPQEDPLRHVYAIYQWVGYLQETLVEALDR
ncbi:MAG: DUF2017 domain-containing protein [Nocardioides sp.]